MSIDYNKDKYNENNFSGRSRNPNSNGFFGGISTGPEQIPRHIHDGVDSPKINQANIVPKQRVMATVQDYVIAGQPNPNTITLSGIVNPTRVDVYGLFYDQYGTANPIARKATIVGSAQLGNIGYYQPNGDITTQVVSLLDKTATAIPNIIQTNVSTGFLNSSGSYWLPFDSLEYNTIATVYINGNNYYEVQITSFDSKSVTFQFTQLAPFIASNGFIQLQIIIS